MLCYVWDNLYRAQIGPKSDVQVLVDLVVAVTGVLEAREQMPRLLGPLNSPVPQTIFGHLDVFVTVLD